MEVAGREDLRGDLGHLSYPQFFWIIPQLGNSQPSFHLTALSLCLYPQVGEKLQKEEITGLKKSMVSLYVNTSYKKA